MSLEIQSMSAAKIDVIDRNDSAAALRAKDQGELDGAGKIKSISGERAAEAAEAAEAAISPAYTVEISEAGQAALQNADGAAQEASAAPQGKSPAGASSAAPPQTASAAAAAADGEESSVDTTNLAQYTAAQLSEFVSQGLLTQAEVNEELANRQNDAASEGIASAAVTESTLNEE